MIFIGFAAQTEDAQGNTKPLMHLKSVVYLLSFVLVQLIVLVTVFEFMRRPWEGIELEVEKILDLQ